MTTVTLRELFSPQFPFSQRARSMKSVSFAILKAETAGVFQTHETLCQEDSWLLVLLCDCFHKSSHYQGSRCLIRFGSRMSRASNNSCHAGRTKNCPRSMSCQSCQLHGSFMQRSSSHQSPVPNREHTCMCQAVTTVREPFAMCNVES